MPRQTTTSSKSVWHFTTLRADLFKELGEDPRDKTWKWAVQFLDDAGLDHGRKWKGFLESIHRPHVITPAAVRRSIEATVWRVIRLHSYGGGGDLSQQTYDASKSRLPYMIELSSDMSAPPWEHDFGVSDQHLATARLFWKPDNKHAFLEDLVMSSDSQEHIWNPKSNHEALVVRRRDGKKMEWLEIQKLGEVIFDDLCGVMCPFLCDLVHVVGFLQPDFQEGQELVCFSLNFGEDGQDHIEEDDVDIQEFRRKGGDENTWLRWCVLENEKHN